VCIPGHIGRILGSYLHDIFQLWHSSFVTMTQLENHMSQPCLTVSVLKIFGLFNLDYYRLPPDGSTDAIQIFFHLFCSIIQVKISSGARPALPIGVAPEAIVGKLVLSIGSNELYLLLLTRSLLYLITSSGARPALPMVVAPEAIVEYFRV
jgi:hypothetical protein